MKLDEAHYQKARVKLRIAIDKALTKHRWTYARHLADLDARITMAYRRRKQRQNALWTVVLIVGLILMTIGVAMLVKT